MIVANKDINSKIQLEKMTIGDYYSNILAFVEVIEKEKENEKH